MNHSSRLKLKGIGSIEILGDIPEVNKEYLMSIVVERSGKRTDEKDADAPVDYYEMTYLRTEQLMEIGSVKKIQVINGKSQSQVLRHTIQGLARQKGADEDAFYQETMSKIIDYVRKKYEE